MSNTINLRATKFVDLPSGVESFGWRLYDDYDKTYCNSESSLSPTDNFEFLKTVLESDDEMCVNVFTHMRATKSGMKINGTWYDWDEIKHLWKESKNVIYRS